MPAGVLPSGRGQEDGRGQFFHQPVQAATAGLGPLADRDLFPVVADNSLDNRKASMSLLKNVFGWSMNKIGRVIGTLFYSMTLTMKSLFLLCYVMK